MSYRKGKIKILGGGINMKRKFFSVLFAVVLVLSMSIVMAPPVAASSVSSVWMEFPTAGHNAFDTDAEYRIHFTPTTAMVRGVDTITVWFPDGTTAMGPAAFASVSGAVTTAAYYTVKGTGTTYYACTSAATAAGYRLKVTTPVDIPAATAAVLKITTSADIETPSTAGNTYKVKVATSQDTTFVTSSAFSVDDTLVSAMANPTGYPSSLVAGIGSAYAFTFDPAGSVSTTGWITVEFPTGTYIPDSIDTAYVKAGAVWADRDDDPSATGVEVDTVARTIKVNPSEATGTAATAYVYFMALAGIKNPEVITATATRDMFIWTSVDAQKVEGNNLIDLDAGSPSKLLFTSLTTPTDISDDATIINAFTGILYLEVQDQYGNFVAPVSEPTVAFATSGSGQVSTSASNLTSFTTSQATSSGKLSLYYRNTVAETDTITASVVAGGYDPCTWSVTVAPKVVLNDAIGNEIGTYGPSTTESVQTLGGVYIQQAIDAAFTGDTVLLGGTAAAPAIYEVASDVLVSKAITIESLNGADYTTIAGKTGFQDILRVTAANVTIDGFTFKGLDTKTGARNAIDVRYGGFTIQNNKFVDIYHDNIWVTAASAAITSGTITNNTLTGMGRDAASRGGISVENQGNGISGVNITNNTVSAFAGHECNGIGVAQVSGAISAIKVQDNTISDCYRGISLYGTVTGMTGTKAIANNTITGCVYGVKASGSNTVGFDLVKNTITGHSIAGIYFYSATLSTQTIDIKYNDISGNGSWGIYNTYTAGADVLALYNWWGDATGPGAGTSAYASTATGSGDNVSVEVTYTPWLHKPKADVVADNANYCTQRVSLAVGIHTLSTPALLITTADTIAELMPDYATNMEYCYKYVNGIWSNIGGDTLTPCHAYYIKMTVADSVLLKYAANEYYTPSKALTAGWNLISPANLSTMYADDAVASVKLTAAGLPGYSQVISPSMNATPWSYSSGEGNATVEMIVGEGYWIYMQNAATLAGFTIFPLVPDFD